MQTYEDKLIPGGTVVVPDQVDRYFRLPLPVPLNAGDYLEFPVILNGTELDRIRINLNYPAAEGKRLIAVAKLEIVEDPIPETPEQPEE